MSHTIHGTRHSRRPRLSLSIGAAVTAPGGGGQREGWPGTGWQGGASMNGKSLSTDALFAPIQINGLTLTNRLVMGPMAVLAPHSDGRPSEQTRAFLAARARGGIGLIIVGGSVATRRAFDESPFQPVLRLDRDDYLPELTRLAEAVHAHGTPLIAELMVGFGRMGKPQPARPNISASPKNVVIPEDRFPRGLIVPGGRTTPVAAEATRANILQLQEETIAAAVRMQKAGWDGVEIPAHMSYLTASFLSPRTNWRTDEYGGSIENRARVLTDMVKALRTAVGACYPIGLRIIADEHLPDGQGPDGYAAIAQLVQRAGADYVALSDGCYETMDVGMSIQDGDVVRQGTAGPFRKALSVPLLLPGFHDPVNAARAVADGHADLVMLARPMLADPDYANKVWTGRLAEINVCDRDNLCLRRLMMNMPVRCSVNSGMGREARAGGLPPPGRWIAAPIERAVLGATASRSLMKFAGKLMARRASRPRS